MKGLSSHNSSVSCCVISYSLLSPCSPVLGCWEPFWWDMGGLWSLVSDSLGTSIYYRAASVEGWIQWCQCTPPCYPWRNVENCILYISRISFTSIKVNGKAAIHLGGNKIRSRVAGIRAWSSKRHWKLRRWLWLHGYFSIAMPAKTNLQALVLALFVTLTPEFLHRVKLLFWVETKQFWCELIFRCMGSLRSVFPHMLCRHNRKAERDKKPARLGVA